MLGLILAAAAATSAIDAERAFERDAQQLGQWTAFRKWAAPGGLMFTPKAVYAQEWLRGRADPPKSVRWQPAQSFQSCDGKVAVNVGPWQRPDGSFGYFTTVWLYEEELVAGPKWMWVYDAGDVLKTPMPAPAEPVVRKASCTAPPEAPAGTMWHRIPSLPSPDAPVPQHAQLHSADRSLLYDFAVADDGSRTFAAFLWDGARYARVVHQSVAAPPK